MMTVVPTPAQASTTPPSSPPPPTTTTTSTTSTTSTTPNTTNVVATSTANGGDNSSPTNNNPSTFYGLNQKQIEVFRSLIEQDPLPAPTYGALIGLAIAASSNERQILDKIYAFVGQYTHLVPNANKNWKNSVRHNLSLRVCFHKIKRSDRTGKILPAWWYMDTAGKMPKVTLIYYTFFKRARQLIPTLPPDACIAAIQGISAEDMVPRAVIKPPRKKRRSKFPPVNNPSTTTNPNPALAMVAQSKPGSSITYQQQLQRGGIPPMSFYTPASIASMFRGNPTFAPSMQQQQQQRPISSQFISPQQKQQFALLMHVQQQQQQQLQYRLQQQQQQQLSQLKGAATNTSDNSTGKESSFTKYKHARQQRKNATKGVSSTSPTLSPQSSLPAKKQEADNENEDDDNSSTSSFSSSSPPPPVVSMKATTPNYMFPFPQQMYSGMPTGYAMTPMQMMAASKNPATSVAVSTVPPFAMAPNMVHAFQPSMAANTTQDARSTYPYSVSPFPFYPTALGSVNPFAAQLINQPAAFASLSQKNNPSSETSNSSTPRNLVSNSTFSGTDDDLSHNFKLTAGAKA